MYTHIYIYIYIYIYCEAPRPCSFLNAGYAHVPPGSPYLGAINIACVVLVERPRSPGPKMGVSVVGALAVELSGNAHEAPKC